MQLPSAIPLFPLPEHVLLPGVATPYRVFEPRYRALVRDLQELPPAERWLSMPMLGEGWREDYDGLPRFHPVSVAALVRHIQPATNGESLIVVEGLARCQLAEMVSTKPYRLASVEALPDLADPMDDATLVGRLKSLLVQVESLAHRLGGGIADLVALTHDHKSCQELVDRLGATLVCDPHDRQRLLEHRVLSKRVEFLIETVGRLYGKADAPTRSWKPSQN
jgi:Lon protease-like protein